VTADVVKRTMAEVVAERNKQATPGRQFVEAFAAGGLSTSVEFDVTITDSLTSSRRKPRYPCRNMLKVTDLSRNPRTFYWHESAPEPGDAPIAESDVRRELASRFHKSPVPELLPTTAWLQVPEDLWTDTDAFQSFIDYRLIVRLGTAENATILCGDSGLLNLPQIARMTSKGPFASTILAACNEVEQMGGTADGLVLNPVDYYRFMGEGGLMDDV
jgi:hypothetical protein